MGVQFLNQYRSHIYLTLALAALFGVYLSYERRPQPEAIQLVTATEAACAATATPEPTIPVVVHVVGAVSAPGVYVLDPDARIMDAVQAAGGMTEQADQEAINLADRLGDGQQIRVPLLGATPPPVPTPLLAGAGSATGTAPAGAVALINLNTASATDLEQLPGIGPALAQRIVAYRQENGQFATVDDVIKVSGIGEAILARIRDLVTVQ